MKTKEKLAAALREANAPLEMIQEAERGGYDDFDSDRMMPINDLVRDCRQAGLHEVAKRAIAGEFDGTGAEASAWFAKFKGTAV